MIGTARGVLAGLTMALVAWGAAPEAGLAQSPNAYYVSTTSVTRNASDSHTCDEARNPDTPKRTIAAALGCLRAGATLYVRGGTYLESLNDGDTDYSGTSWTNTTRIVAHAGEAVVVKAPIGAGFAIQIGRRSYVEFDGITVDAAGVVYDGVKLNGSSHHIRFRGGAILNATHQGVNIQDAAYGHELVAVNIDGNGSSSLDHGIYIATSGNLVEGSRIHGNSGYGVHVYNEGCSCANRNIVRNNRIYANGFRSQGFGVILGSGVGNAAYNNLVYGNRGGIQVAHSSPAGTRVYHNTVVDNGSWGGIAVHGDAAGTEIKNNIVYRSQGADLTADGSGTIATNNLVGADPQFVDLSSSNFALLGTSPAVDRGVTLPEVGFDFDRAARPVGAGYDIGALEHGGRPVPGKPTNLRILPRP